jgi:hypothetical protein
MSASILGPNGMPMVELAGDRAWLIRPKGDLMVSMQWIDCGGEEPEPCMCLFPAARHMDTAAYVIRQHDAWAYATNKGDASPHLIGAAFKAALHMGFFPDKSTVHRVIDAVLENLADLVRMPSSQPASLEVARKRMGVEYRATVNGRTMIEGVV